MQPKTIKGQRAKLRYILDFFSCDDAFDFCARYVKPGNYLYGEYMSYKVKELKSKINL